jgi:hypothetical protein
VIGIFSKGFLRKDDCYPRRFFAALAISIRRGMITSFHFGFVSDMRSINFSVCLRLFLNSDQVSGVIEAPAIGAGGADGSTVGSLIGSSTCGFVFSSSMPSGVFIPCIEDMPLPGTASRSRTCCFRNAGSGFLAIPLKLPLLLPSCAANSSGVSLLAAVFEYHAILFS